MKKIYKAATLLLAAALLLAGCQAPAGQPAASQPDPTPPQSQTPPAESYPGGAVPGLNAENIPDLDGSLATMPLLARVYAEVCGGDLENAEAQVNATFHNTAGSWQSIAHDTSRSQLLIVYEAPEEIKDIIADSRVALEVEPLGRDGLVFLVNKQNPVASLTRQQLIDIYTGKITDWSEVGGAAEAIVPFQRNATSGSQTLFLKLLMGDIPPMAPPTELVQETMGGLIDGVAAFDGSGQALGFSVYYYAELMIGNPQLKLLSVDGVAPGADTIADQTYPLTNDFYVVIRADEPQDSPARLLRDWLLTDAGRKILEDEDYVWARG